MVTQANSSAFWYRLLALWLLLSGTPVQGEALTVGHQLQVRLDPSSGAIQGRDRIVLPEGLEARFVLHAALTPESAYPLQALEHEDAALRHYRVQLPAGVRSFELSFSGRLTADGDNTVSADNVVLGPDAGWYPVFGEAPVRFSLTVQLPAGWHSVSQGAAEWIAPSDAAMWRADTPQRGIWLVAAPFTRYDRSGAWGQAQAFLRQPDRDLARDYLNATVEYLRLYSRLIGPYPYPKFALVENQRQTGYGMPSFTLLGSRVIRLPFIVHTSYPHEILHNWWGNGVWVDYEQGNWAEALTTYLADYMLAERRGRGTDQRRAALQKYADFVAEHNDFPLRRFHARHGEASQAVGYSKGMFLFHMLRRQLGDTRFVAALREFYRQYLFREAGFDDLQRVFEQVGGTSLQTEFEQWLERTGAPELRLGDVSVSVQAQAFRIRLELQQAQPGPAYRLRVPVAVQLAGRNTAQLRALTMTDKRQTFVWTVPARPLRVAVDPEFDVFRRLHPAELPPSLGSLLGAPRSLFVLPAEAAPELRRAYRELAGQWAGPQDRIVSDRDLESLPAGPVWLLGAENQWLPDLRQALAPLPARIEDGSVRLEDRRWPRTDYSFAMTVSGPAQQPRAWIAAPTPEAVAALARKLPHYTRYSYLAFAEPGTRNRLKGQWPVTGSPLERLLDKEFAGSLELPQRPPLSAVLGPGLHAPP